MCLCIGDRCCCIRKSFQGALSNEVTFEHRSEHNEGAGFTRPQRRRVLSGRKSSARPEAGACPCVQGIRRLERSVQGAD